MASTLIKQPEIYDLLREKNSSNRKKRYLHLLRVLRSTNYIITFIIYDAIKYISKMFLKVFKFSKKFDIFFNFLKKFNIFLNFLKFVCIFFVLGLLENSRKINKM